MGWPCFKFSFFFGWGVGTKKIVDFRVFIWYFLKMTDFFPKSKRYVPKKATKLQLDEALDMVLGENPTEPLQIMVQIARGHYNDKEVSPKTSMEAAAKLLEYQFGRPHQSQTLEVIETQKKFDPSLMSPEDVKSLTDILDRGVIDVTPEAEEVPF